MKTASWPDVALGDHVDLLTGFPFKSSEYTTRETDVKLLRGDNIAQGVLRWDGVKRWSREDANAYQGFLLEPGDVVLAMDRPWIEAGLKWAMVREETLPVLLVQRVARMRGRGGLRPLFLKCVIGAEDFTEYVKSITTGANVPHISGPDIKKYKFRLPPLPAQDRIAEILSAYDDLIENNTKRIKILEEMARSLYREWFVSLRFPGHEKAKLFKSAVATLPAGWHVSKVEQVYRTSSGGTPSRKRPEYFAEPGRGIRWVKTKELLDGWVVDTEENVSAEGLAKSSAKVFPAGTLLVAMYGATIGQLGLLARPAATNQACCAVLPTNSSYGTGLAWCYFRENREAIISLGLGAAQPNISQAVVRNLDMIVPPADLAARFESTVMPILEAMRNLHERATCLRSCRDLLLPRLISGEIDVASLPMPS